jgi:hypothetical protein
MLTDEQFDDYLKGTDTHQEQSIRLLRALLLECEPGLKEEVCTDKWYGGLLVYRAPNNYPIYALGPRSAGKTTFHMMPFYGSKVLQERHGAVLKKFLTGKSCITFKNADDLPLDAIRDILTGGSANLAKAVAELEESRRVKSKNKAS